MRTPSPLVREGLLYVLIAIVAAAVILAPPKRHVEPLSPDYALIEEASR